MKKYVNYLVLGASFALVPSLAFAQGPEDTEQALDNLGEVGEQILDFINDILVPLVFAIAFLVFIWGLFRYLIAGGADEEKRSSGRQLMLWGIIAFFVMVSVWGLVNILVGTFDLENSNLDSNDLPETPGSRN